ncbi:universal stress protein [Ktedonospora formicarum]|uniref:UspA domain-containing protein n=1 Tax=Ktedonospora formicarum TaxID=2778364 RepID=A0A8J3MXL8_9CHLR|nr:universal stress protein [Ktedonospora formicarum]GHO48710.1 hypothetical protein KSX_68730 [Ktedonospora formicarum]
MFHRLLVPLDESEQSEQALPVAARLAHVWGGDMLLLEVVPMPIEFGPFWGDPPPLVQQAMRTDKAQANTYLSRIIHSEPIASVRTETKTVFGQPASMILTTIQEQHIDLLVMTSHGRSGLSRWVLGSVAEKVARQAPIPVLVLHAYTVLQRPNTSDHSLRALIALDGSPAAEAAIAPATQVIRALASPEQAHLHLLHVLPMASARNRSARQEQKAGAYLQQVSERLQYEQSKEPILNVSWSLTFGQDVAETLLKTAEEGIQREKSRPVPAYDLLALTTHGWGGFPPWGLGSISERLLRTRSTCPLLLVRSPEMSSPIHLYPSSHQPSL